MPYLVRAFPVLPGKENQLRMMATEIAGPRNDQARAFYRGLGVSHESWHVQQTPLGTIIIVVTSIEDTSEGGKRLAAHDDGFGDWFKSRVRGLSGIDPDTQPLGPPTEQIFEWNGQ